MSRARSIGYLLTMVVTFSCWGVLAARGGRRCLGRREQYKGGSEEEVRRRRQVLEQVHRIVLSEAPARPWARALASRPGLWALASR